MLDLHKNYLKLIRERLNMSQFEIAAKAGVSLSTIQGVESGRAKNLHGRTRLKLAEAYGVTPDQIPTGHSSNPEPISS